MLSTLLLVTLLATLCVPGNSQHDPFLPGFPYGSQPVRGVNLGGWLVLEVCYRPYAPL